METQNPWRRRGAALAPLTLPILLSLAACQGAEKDFERAERTKDPTVVVKTLRLGMTSAEVEQVMGHPSFVSEDDEHHTEWTFHKCARAIEAMPDGTTYRILAFKDADAVKKSRKRLSIIVTLDAQKKVYEVSHRTRIVDYPVD